MPDFNLTGNEAKCQAAFKPWFTAGGWTTQHFTKPESANFQIQDILNDPKNSAAKESLRPKLWDYLNAFEFPHDGEAVRGELSICFDYKYHAKSHLGFGVQKKAYLKYLSYKKPWFYILMYAEDRQKLYTHQIRDPVAAGYKITYYGGYAYYNVEPDCVEAKIPDFPVTFQMNTEDMNNPQSIALTIALKLLADNGFSEPFKSWTDDDLREAEAILHQPKNKHRMGIALRKWHNRLTEPEDKANIK